MHLEKRLLSAFLNNPLNLQVLLSSISWQFQLHFLDLNQMTYYSSI